MIQHPISESMNKQRKRNQNIKDISTPLCLVGIIHYIQDSEQSKSPLMRIKKLSLPHSLFPPSIPPLFLPHHSRSILFKDGNLVVVTTHVKVEEHIQCEITQIQRDKRFRISLTRGI